MCAARAITSTMIAVMEELMYLPEFDVVLKKVVMASNRHLDTDIGILLEL